MKKRAVIASLLLAVATFSVNGISFELGAMAGGGPGFAYGSYLSTKAVMLAELGGSTLGTPGSSQAGLFPGWSAGGYAEIALIDWLGVRLEPRMSFMGASLIALTDAGIPFDRYGVCFYGAVIPLLARARVAVGPGNLAIAAGPFIGVVTSAITIVDTYASATTTVSVSPGPSLGWFFGLSGGIGYATKLGPGFASLEIVADWPLTPATSNTGPVGGEIFPLGVNLMVGYGFRLGEDAR